MKTMDRELIKRLYWKANGRCNLGVSWEFEENFLKVILQEIVPLIDYSYRDTKQAIEQYFGVELNDE